MTFSNFGETTVVNSRAHPENWDGEGPRLPLAYPKLTVWLKDVLEKLKKEELRELSKVASKGSGGGNTPLSTTPLRRTSLLLTVIRHTIGGTKTAISQAIVSRLDQE